MARLLAAAMVVVVLFCLARAFLPALHHPGHRRDLDAWHVVMAGVMAVMLVGSLDHSFSLVALAGFVAGLGWALVRAGRRATRTAYLRLGVGCAAMAVMLLPPATATATPTAAVTSTMGHDMGAMHHAAAASTDGSGGSAFAPPAVLLAALIAVLGLVLVLRLVGSLRPAGAVPARLDACCDVAMAATMGYMLVLML